MIDYKDHPNWPEPAKPSKKNLFMVMGGVLLFCMLITFLLLEGPGYIFS